MFVDGLELAGGCGQVSGAEKGLDLLIGDRRPGRLRRGDQSADLRQVGNRGQGSRQHLDDLLGDAGDVVVAVERGEVAGDIYEIGIAAAPLLEAAQPHRKRPFVLGGQVGVGVAGDQAGGPRVHRDVVAGGEQGEVLQPCHISPQARYTGLARRSGHAGAGGKGEGQVVKGHRGAADRDLAQHAGLAEGEQGEEFGEQDVSAAQQHRLAHGRV